jgi:hypothetical protein
MSQRVDRALVDATILARPRARRDGCDLMLMTACPYVARVSACVCSTRVDATSSSLCGTGLSVCPGGCDAQRKPTRPRRAPRLSVCTGAWWMRLQRASSCGCGLDTEVAEVGSRAVSACGQGSGGCDGIAGPCRSTSVSACVQWWMRLDMDMQPKTGLPSRACGSHRTTGQHVDRGPGSGGRLGMRAGLVDATKAGNPTS